MDIYKIINEEACSTDFRAKDKWDAIKIMSQLIAKKIKNFDSEQIFQALKKREDSSSTGFEDGVAIPHAKIKGLDDFYMGIFISKKGLDFKSIDHKKTRLLFVIVGPEEKTRIHLQILAQISRISRNTKARKELLSATSNEALKEAFIRYTVEKAKKQTEEKNKLYFVILNELRFFDDILQVFVGKGIHGVNVLESTGVKDQLSNIPLFGDFLNFLGERRDVSKTIMTVIPESEVLNITQSIEEIIGDLDKHTGAMIMALDIPYYKGSMVI